MACSHLLYVTISLFSLLSLFIAYRKRTCKSPVSVSHSQQPSIPPPSRPARIYDVLLSIRGEVTRNNFVGHLYKALDRLGIHIIKDDQLYYLGFFCQKGWNYLMRIRKRTRKSPVSVLHSQQPSIPPPSRPARIYDVLLSMRGEVTLNSFVGHLYKALDRLGIHTIKDDQLYYLGLFCQKGWNYLMRIRKRTRKSPVSVSHSQQPSIPPSSMPARIYDVLLSMRGEVTLNSFVGHLYKALDRLGIHTIKDDQLYYLGLFCQKGWNYLMRIRKRTRKSPVSVSHLQQPSIPPPSRPARTYDVFLSFKGEDTRNNFVGHLYKALDRLGIYTFKDDQKLKKGKSVALELLKSIEESRYSIVILSKNYATSAWCLDELVKIIHCMDQFGQIVVPIFYNVDPSDVRKQTGSFKRAFDHHERAFKKEKEKVLQWREALRKVGSISGSDSRNRDESVLIEEIVRDVSSTLISESSNNSKLGGTSDHMERMSYHIERMKSLLCNDGSNEVLMLGIWGTGSKDKTAITRALYDTYSPLYDGRCYVGNVKDKFRKHDPSYLREKILSEIFLDRNLKIDTLNDNFNVIKERLSRKKVFIVLEDVDSVKQLETFADKHDWFGPGSRIIITTTKDVRFLISHRVNRLYNVRANKYTTKFFGFLADTFPNKLFV